jgi:mannose-1-phosphate guanylyltransferase/phosphomannomutase
VRVSPDDRRVIDVKLLDRSGHNADKNTERKIETAFFREDFRRVSPEDIGAITIVPDPTAHYRAAFVERCDSGAIGNARGRAVIDYGLGTASVVLPGLLNELGAEAVAVNAATRETFALRTPAQHRHDVRQLAAMCRAIGASLGATMDSDGKEISLVDDRGNIVPPLSALAAFAALAWRTKPGCAVAVPLTAPLMMETLAVQHGGRVIRLQANPQAQMRAGEMGSPDAPVLIGDGEGGYAFPDFHPGFDGLMAVARLLQYLGAQDARLSEVVAALPEYYVAALDVPCPWDSKGRVMRRLHERASAQATGDGEQIDGVRFDLGREWALVLPDPYRPLFHVYTESGSPEHATALGEKYVELVQRSIGG